jgi:hypothetical protein
MEANYKVLFIAPNEDLTKKVRTIIDKNNWNSIVALKTGNNYAGLEYAKDYYKNGIQAVISRGGTCQAIKNFIPGNELPRCKQTGYRKTTAQGNKIAASSGELTPK